MPKRKSVAVEEAPVEPPRRRSLRNASTTDSAPAVKPSSPETKMVKKPGSKQEKKQKQTAKKAAKITEPIEESENEASASEPDSPPPAKKSRSSKTKAKSVPAKAAKPAKSQATSTSTAPGEKTYWLLKAEPETRLENGIDVSFSIDDLASKTVPEPWDGIRAYPARNNLRSMKKGDLAFFYHSNCKEPGIVGTMEIVQEHSPDLSAHDPKAPYYDASSKPEDPKWSVVHVEFRSKFKKMVTLRELRDMGGKGGPLENMQMLKQSRLSVSRVSEAEWEYLMGVVEERGG
ncbi:hypothetical protein OQA88_3107 [Cercophora sp. LCS_1]